MMYFSPREKTLTNIDFIHQIKTVQKFTEFQFFLPFMDHLYLKYQIHST